MFHFCIQTELSVIYQHFIHEEEAFKKELYLLLTFKKAYYSRNGTEKYAM